MQLYLYCMVFMRYLLALFLFLTSCGGISDSCVDDWFGVNDYEEDECCDDRFSFYDRESRLDTHKEIDYTPFSEVIIPYSQELRRTRRLRFEDSKIYFDNAVRRFRVIYSTQDILELCDVRELIVHVVEGLLERMNSHPDVEVTFDHAPITADDLEIYISFESYFIEYVDPHYIAWVSLHDGFVRYYSGVLKDPRQDFWHHRIEPYAKARTFVQISQDAEEQYLRAHPKKTREPRIRIAQ